jgi:hypothetical protein
MSKRNPSASKRRALPPGVVFFSKTVTSAPEAATQQAAERPAKPDPITATRFTKTEMIGYGYKLFNKTLVHVKQKYLC